MVHLYDMIALTKRNEENSEQHHEVAYLVNDRNHHCHEEIQLLKDADQVNDFDQGEHDAEAPEYAQSRRYRRVLDVNGCSNIEDDDAGDFQIIPDVFKVIAAFLVNLDHLIDGKQALHSDANTLEHVEEEVLLSLKAIALGLALIDGLTLRHVDVTRNAPLNIHVVEDEEDQVE